MKRYLLYILLLLMPLAIFGQKLRNHNLSVGRNLDIFNQVYKNLHLLYVDTLNPQEVIGAGINAMLRTLDPYTEYYAESKDLKSFITGKYAGIGALIRYNMKEKNAVIDEPYEGTPSQEAGLKKGDIILSVDDSTMVGKDTKYVSNHLRGDAGTTFLLKIRRPSTGKEMKMKITRRTIKQAETIPYTCLTDDSIGYIYLTQFTEGCTQDVRRAFVDLKKRGMSSLILDLRGNGGGSEAEAALLVNMFVPRGITVVSNKGKFTQACHDYKTTLEPTDTIMPIVVLVNGETASASEITSGALQDLDRAVIMGQRTYGKGLVQMPIDLPYNTNLKVTTARYYIPSGRCIQAINYSSGKSQTYTERIPDSLTHVFHTRGGREVRDGGGITPDIVLKSDTMPNIAYYLSGAGLDSTEVMFTYVCDYIAAHPTIAPASKFHLTDADYSEFKRRVVESGFTYDAISKKQLAELVKTAKFEGYYDDAREAFELLEKKLKHNIANELDRHRESIIQMLEQDIVAAYYYQRGAIEAGLGKDKQYKEACQLLRHPDRYKAILTKGEQSNDKNN
ncbi:MAG: S41 family peptidase [Prevotella sp.]|nr:S41 family peptidase [Prevotella sp.]